MRSFPVLRACRAQIRNWKTNLSTLTLKAKLSFYSKETRKDSTRTLSKVPQTDSYHKLKNSSKSKNPATYPL